MTEAELDEKSRDKALETMRNILDSCGITSEYLTNKLKEELDAKETKHFAYQGVAKDKKNIIAWEIRQRARQDAHKLRGDYPAEKHQIDGDLQVDIINYAASKADKDVDK